MLAATGRLFVGSCRGQGHSTAREVPGEVFVLVGSPVDRSGSGLAQARLGARGRRVHERQWLLLERIEKGVEFGCPVAGELLQDRPLLGRLVAVGLGVRSDDLTEGIGLIRRERPPRLVDHRQHALGQVLERLAPGGILDVLAHLPREVVADGLKRLCGAVGRDRREDVVLRDAAGVGADEIRPRAAAGCVVADAAAECSGALRLSLTSFCHSGVPCIWRPSLPGEDPRK